MTWIMILGIATVIAIFAFITWLDAFLNRKEEFASIQEWHNFRNALSNKGEK